MDSNSNNSFKGYGKVDEAEQAAAFKRKSRTRIIIIGISMVVLLAIVGAVAGALIHRRSNSSPSTQATPAAASLKTVCSVTQYPKSCYSSISSMANSNSTDPEILFKLSLQVAIDKVSKLCEHPKKLQAEANDTQWKSALGICVYLFEDALDQLNDSVATLEVGKGENNLLTTSKIDDLRTWLSSTSTDLETCVDTLLELNETEHFNATVFKQLKAAMQNSMEYASNSLAIVTKVLKSLTDTGFKIPIHRRLLGFPRRPDSNSEFPNWVERRLLQEESKPVPNVVVAKDGSGQFLTINDAVKLIGKKNQSRFVIYVKEGTYVENVFLDKSMWNVMIYGDGKDKTIISGSLNSVDGIRTFATATFEWVDNVEPPSSIFYGEYLNTGPGSNVDQRVKWAGYRPALSDVEAGKFTVETFLKGREWLPDATVSYKPTL
ncbi:Pectinesterase, catalytic [Corchorus capsularis]|uniref:Pectinesterase n=1 Tax=Corchorus capsularis TaxID=210143 RepID=A0A1R3HJT5_COCAP|nr:Pectinesterase, catalytic [Corchorus capsularis]